MRLKQWLAGAAVLAAATMALTSGAAAQSGEISALVAYSTARVGLDQALGATLEVNHVSIAEARAGKVTRTSPNQ